MSGEVAFGCAISEDRKHCSIVAAGREKGGTRLVVDLVWYDHPRGAVARLSGLWEKHDPVAVVVNPKSQSGTLVKPLGEAGILLTVVTAQDVAVAHGEFLDIVNDGRPGAPGPAAADGGGPGGAAAAAGGRAGVGSEGGRGSGAAGGGDAGRWAFSRWEELAQPGAWAF